MNPQIGSEKHGELGHSVVKFVFGLKIAKLSNHYVQFVLL